MTRDGAVDLRSDTFTVPDEHMRRLMAHAEVGDDVWGEDPTVTRLEERVAALLGFEAAVFTPSGSMANLCAVLAQTSPGDELVADTHAHVVNDEAGSAAVIGGVQLRTLDFGADAAPSADAVRAAVRTPDVHHPVTRLLALENTHNRRGGVAVAADRIAGAAEAAHDCGLRVHCDGARLFNAAVALGVEASELVASCDSVSVCFSKGLGAPIGSALASDARTIDAARQWRKRLGGGMRQAGIVAAGALDALERNRTRLAEDHANAQRLAALLDGVGGAELVVAGVPTNIVLLRTVRPAAEVVAAAAREGVLITEMDRHLVRCMTYIGVGPDEVDRAARALRAVLETA
ncbi:MAG TPA: GntG family PLP-dependent aldolase [Candidatus Dormibacteraeota bacterium]|nr:GntG family PLP-dependent aldolase [Candidatus Dormibacteraeota bacterium]